MKKYIFTLLLGTVSLFMSSQQIVRFWVLQPKNDLVVLVNFDTITRDLSNYRIVTANIDTPIGKLDSLFGTPHVVKGRETVALLNFPMDDIKGSISLFLPDSDINSPGGLCDFFQWGDSSQKNENWADSIKIINAITNMWKKGDYMKGAPPYTNHCDEFDYGVHCWSAVKPPIIIIRFKYIEPSKNIFTIYNAGVSNIDVSSATLCINGNCYDSLKNSPFTVLKGSLNVAKNDSVVIHVDTNIKFGKHGSLALFALPKQQTDTTLMLDFVQWGDTLEPYSRLASQKGIWDSLQTIHLQTDSDILFYTGNFNRLQSGAAWWQTHTPLGFADIAQKYISIFPNPVSDKLYITNSYFNQLKVYNAEGKTEYNNMILKANETIDCSGWKSGLYLFQFTDNSGKIYNKKCIVMQ